ncbi:AAA family ATPase [Streptomyces sp. SBT349]|uniref:AAA family ATPase n=1 Tax=Streptomyces sp. SBT349 TaxID=1580539 RepID=UPI00066A77ED|nr:AAA family ATPase [Streptomyces sp. SBT349]
MAEGELRALCVGIGTFATAAADGEPDLDAWTPLPFAAARARALAAELAAFGYAAETVHDPTAEELGARVRATVRAGAPTTAVVAHVLSHGERATTGLYAVGADGSRADHTKIDNWLGWVEDRRGGPPALFLLDLCGGGSAARLPWQLQAAAEAGRAWVIAAAGPEEPAWDGRFSQAVATVLAAVRSGALDLHPSQEYVPLGTLITRIRAEVDRLGARGLGQRVTATPVDGEYPPLPFFRNPGHQDDPVRRATAALDPAAAAFLDAAHFMDRASGHGPMRHQVAAGCFTGRDVELALLTDWLDTAGPPGIALVTGGPGTGKSALLGVLVCAAHPGLRAATTHLWRHATSRPSAHDQLVALHARHRGVRDLTTSLARQLGAPDGDVTAAVRALQAPPVVVLDALDESDEPEAVLTELLLPLARTCRVLVGTRPWEEFAGLRATADHDGLLVDLDTVAADRLRAELARYVEDLLALRPGLDGLALAPVRAAFACRLADGLAADPTWGAFLLAALVTHHAVARRSLATRDVPGARRLAGEIPLVLPRVFDAEIPTPRAHTVLTALAHAHGQGMPVAVLARVAGVFGDGGDGGAAAEAEVLEVLRRSRFYLRTSSDSDGTTLYRLFHQALADHLRVAEPPGLLDRLLALGVAAAEPYVLRHAIQHAAAVGRVDDLLTDAEFLVHADPGILARHLGRARSPAARTAAAAYRMSMDQPGRADPTMRRGLLAVDAARHGDRALAARLADGLGWKPLWATGGAASREPLGVLVGSNGGPTGLHDLDATTLAGRPVAVTVAGDGRLRLWDLATHTHLESVRLLGGPADRVACTTLAGRPVAVTAGPGGLDVWDLSPLRPLARGRDWPANLGTARDLVCATWSGRRVALVSLDGTAARGWDLASGEPAGPPVKTRNAYVAGATADGRPLLVVSRENGGARVWDGATGAFVGPLRTPGASSHGALGCAERDGRPVVVVADGVSGRVLAWDLATRQPAGVLRSRTGRGSVLCCAVLDGVPVAVVALAHEGRSEVDVGLWDLRGRQAEIAPAISGRGRPVRAACATVAGRRTLLVAEGPHAVRLWHAAERPEEFRGHLAPVRSLATVPAPGGTVLVGRDDLTTAVWHLATGAPWPPADGRDPRVPWRLNSIGDRSRHGSLHPSLLGVVSVAGTPSWSRTTPGGRGTCSRPPRWPTPPGRPCARSSARCRTGR